MFYCTVLIVTILCPTPRPFFFISVLFSCFYLRLFVRLFLLFFFESWMVLVLSHGVDCPSCPFFTVHTLTFLMTEGNSSV